MSPLFEMDQYLIQTKFLRIFGGAFWFKDLEGNVVAYSKQKRFKIKEDIINILIPRVVEQLPANIKMAYEKTPLAQAMPEEYKNEDAITAYRDYCINEKHYAKWERNRTKPIWWTTQEVA